MKNYLSEKEISTLVEVIKSAEEYSTGEIRVHIDTSTEEEKAEVALDVFTRLGMHQTEDRNAVLFHINFKQRYLSIIGDEGIHQKICQSFWDKLHDEMTSEFAKNNYFFALKEAILKTGIELKKHFPVKEGNNPNELPDEITFS